MVPILIIILLLIYVIMRARCSGAMRMPMGACPLGCRLRSLSESHPTPRQRSGMLLYGVLETPLRSPDMRVRLRVRRAPL